MRRSIKVLIVLVALVGACAAYVLTHPLIFNESFFEHAHCIKIAAGALVMYAEDHNGKFPAHTNGYGDALVLVVEGSGGCLTGPGYDGDIFKKAAESGQHIPETMCGRVYVQGLSRTDNPEIVLLFDKLATPGGDHCHLLRRLRAPLMREVAFVDGSIQAIPESKWPEFARKQIQLLIEAGIPKAEAERLYAAP